MKIKTIVLVFCFAALGITSCKKCITCSDSAGQNSQDYCGLHQADLNNIKQHYTDSGGSCQDK